MYKKLLPILLILFILIMPGVSGATMVSGAFADTRGHWAEQAINTSHNLGIMNGTAVDAQGNYVFAPEGQVTRAQLAAVLVRTFQLDYGTKKFIKEPLASDYYQDLSNQAWYAGDAVICAINSIFDSSAMFYPDRNMTRIEAAQAIQHCFHAKGINIPMTLMMPQYEDTTSLSQSEMNALVFVSNTGIMKGDAGLFRPYQGMKRGELASMMNHCAKLIAVNEDDNDTQYSLKVGQNFTLSLASNPTTGYQWDFSNRGDEKILSLASESYQSDAVPGQLLMGQGGRNYWTFKALNPGTTELALRYARPWESVQAAQVFNLKVIVEAAGTASCDLTINNKKVSDKSELINIDLEIPSISGMKDKQIQSAVNARFEKEALDLQAGLSAQAKEYRAEAQKNGFPVRPFELFTRFQVGCQNEQLLSLTIDYYQYTGGAHGLTDRRPYNIELASGQALALKDLFNEHYNYAAIINQEIRQQIAADKDGMYFEDPNGFNGISNDQCYYLQDGTLVIYFGQYEIAPYAAGILEFKIPLSSLRDGLKAGLIL